MRTRCSITTNHTHDHEAAVVRQGEATCGACQIDLAEAVDRLLEAAVALRTAATHTPRQDPGHHRNEASAGGVQLLLAAGVHQDRAGAGEGEPEDLGPLELIDRLARIGRRLKRERGIITGSDIDAAIAYHQHLEADFITPARAVLARSAALTGDADRRGTGVPCPECRGATVIRWADAVADDAIYCAGGCGWSAWATSAHAEVWDAAFSLEGGWPRLTDAASFLGRSPESLRTWVRSGELPSSRDHTGHPTVSWPAAVALDAAKPRRARTAKAA